MGDGTGSMGDADPIQNTISSEKRGKALFTKDVGVGRLRVGERYNDSRGK